MNPAPRRSRRIFARRLANVLEAAYAAGGIQHFWRVENTDDLEKLRFFRYGLDPTTKTYAPAAVHDGPFTVTDPFTVNVDLAGLL